MFSKLARLLLSERFRVHIVLSCLDFRRQARMENRRYKLPALPLSLSLQLFVLPIVHSLWKFREPFGVPMISAPPRVDERVGRRTLYRVRLHILKFIEALQNATLRHAECQAYPHL